ncbi:MAG TPA: rhodanese-like domain-containing protein [Arenibaculum sp.]|nr:rhodanese-like domain-containing protein [Arenibaculum sp.]
MTGTMPLEIDVAQLHAMRRAGEPLVVLDVREPWELDICKLDDSLDVPMRTIPARVGDVPRDRPVVVLCHHGGRSANVTAWLRQQGFGNATNLQGGIHAWARQIDPSMKVY